MSNSSINDTTVNPQITDSVSQATASVLCNASSEAMGLIDLVSAETLGMSMHNAVTAQQNSQMSTTASVTAACARMIQAQTQPDVPKPEPSPNPTVPPPFLPLDGKTPAEYINEAVIMAETAIALNKAQKGSDKTDEKGLKALLAKLKQLTGSKDKDADPNTDKHTDPKTDNGSDAKKAAKKDNATEKT